MNSKSLSNDPELRMYLEDIHGCKFLEKEEERDLIAKFQGGDKTALEPLVRSQLLFVVSMAKKYFSSCKSPIHPMDLIQAGNEGLIKAIEKFKLSNKTRLSTYAAWWIRQKIVILFAKESSMIRVPAYIHNHSIEFRKFFAKFGREPTVQEFAKFAQISVTLAERVIVFEKTEKNPASLDSPVRNDEGDKVSLGSIAKVFAPEEKTPEGSVLRDALRVKTNCLLIDLFYGMKERDAEIVKLRLGISNYNQSIADPDKRSRFGVLGDSGPMTLDDIGKIYGITRERVRQIVEKFMEEKSGKLERLKKHLLGD